ncbi:BnaA02g07310D [Brassica napus]|uniref:BnaA02g07310D protein n=1 Tax=Brassica napus TaxID=3708 RepID=A0A078H5E3_BRANA|nr:BnaA02g07310D [Brassica napus]
MECATSSQPLRTQLKQCMETRPGGVEPELVKYMSKLPVFLERADTTTQENLLSVGVLPWSRLENWHHSHNNRMVMMMPVKNRFPSSLVPPPRIVHQRRHRSSRQTKKPKDHRGGLSVPDEQQLVLNTNAQDGVEKKVLKGKICPRTGTLSKGLMSQEVGVHKEVISMANISRNKKSEKKQEETKLYHSTKKLSLKEAKTSKKSSTKKVQKVRAVLHATVKNNQPLFTFTGECISVYTFFSIKDRNSSWLNQRGRGQTHGVIISNVVAQMRVSSSSSLPSGSMREFVLFSVELDQESVGKSDHLQLKNELAAIIVKRRASLNHNAVNKDISATVILQSGVHSMPHKGGGPSSLIQRWRTGGSCDCGGWDMGCNLRILTTSNSFELFFLGEQAEEHPFLSYKPIKEGIYSVVYDSSLSQLQAFSICMALAESRKMSDFTLGHKSSRDQHKARVESVLVPDQMFKD